MKKLLNRLKAQENVTLAPLTTLKIGGPAKYFVVINSLKDLAELQTASIEYQMPLHVLSGGSNTLFSDSGFDGVVLKLGNNFNNIESNQDGSISADAAVSFAKTTNIALAHGWMNALGWAGTPGLIGGAVRMNAGSRLGEIGDSVHRVFGIHQGKFIDFYREDLIFDYRHNNLPKDMIITKVILKPHGAITDPQILCAKLNELRAKRKKTQPAKNSAGSFFKNPKEEFAARLIEACQLKGISVGGAQISFLHANFIINKGHARANDVIEIAGVAQRAVKEKFGIFLQPEIKFVGKFKNHTAFSLDF